MSSADATSSFEVITAADGSIPADELARHGVGAGTRLRVVPEGPFKSAKGLLTGKLPDLTPEDFDEISAEVTALVDQD
jgi:hypothetical protein